MKQQLIFTTVFLFLFFGDFCSNSILAQGCSNLYPNNCPKDQNHANRWYFGQYAGLDFNSQPVEVLTDNTVVQQLEGNACISDSVGNFVLATGGTSNLTIWNGLFDKVSNEFNLLGNISATQSSIIIPRPNAENQYYIFALNVPADHPAYENGFSYSHIEISQPDFTANILVENKILVPRISEKISAVKHSNGKDVWVVVHEWDSRAFLAYLVTRNGLIEQPVVSDAGSFHSPDGNNINQAIGQMKFSPDGTRLALAIYGKDMFEIFKFNNSNGIVEDAVASQPEFPGAYGLEFSEDGNFLYGSTINVDGSATFESKIIQFNVKAGEDIFETGIDIVSNSNGSYFCGMQLATDGKIYVARSPQGEDNLGVIHNPGRPGLACNFNSVNNTPNIGLSLEGNESRFGLPTFNQSYFCLPKFIYENNCFGDITTFSIVNTTNVDSVRWYCPYQINSREMELVHLFPAPGIYNLRLTEYFNGTGYTDSLNVVINPLPVVNINGGLDTMILLPEASVSLDAGGGFASHLWNNNRTERVINVSEEGWYWVDVSNKSCCFKRDSIYVELVNIVVPNAFIPSGSGPDKYFRIIDQENVIVEFSIIIYNRWGQQVFESDDKFFQWDGEDYGTDVFYYTFNAILTNGYAYKKNGNITLIR